MWHLKYVMKRFIYNREEDTQIQKTNLWLPHERMLDWEFGVSRYKLLYTGWIDNKLYSTGN